MATATSGRGRWLRLRRSPPAHHEPDAARRLRRNCRCCGSRRQRRRCRTSGMPAGSSRRSGVRKHRTGPRTREATHPQRPRMVRQRPISRASPSSAMRQLMLSSPSTTPALALGIAAADDRPEVLKACAASAACPPCLLGMLAHHADWATRRAAAASEACPPSMLEHLTRDNQHEVRIEAAANPATPLVPCGAWRKDFRRLRCGTSRRFWPWPPTVPARRMLWSVSATATTANC